MKSDDIQLASPTRSPSGEEIMLQDKLIIAQKDPGVREWLVVAGAWFVQFSTFGYTYAFGVFQDYYTRIYLLNSTPSNIGYFLIFGVELASTDVQSSWIGGVNFGLTLCTGVIAGKLFDKGHFYPLIIIGTILYLFSLFMLSLAKPNQYYQVFLSQGVGMGLAAGLVFTPSIANIARQFLRKGRALATGIALAGGGMGGIIFPIMINRLLPVHGFGDTVRRSAFVVLGCMIIGVVLMVIRKPPANVLAAGAVRPSVAEFFKEPAYLLHVFAAFLLSSGVFFPIFYLQLYSVQHDVDPNLAFYSLAIVNGMTVVGRVGANALSDVVGILNMAVFCSLISAGSIWAILGIHNRGILIGVSIVYGIFSGAAFSLGTLVSSLLAKSPAEIGARNGLAFAIGGLGALFSGAIQGALLTKHRFEWIRPIAYSSVYLDRRRAAVSGVDNEVRFTQTLVFIAALSWAIIGLMLARRNSQRAMLDHK